MSLVSIVDRFNAWLGSPAPAAPGPDHLVAVLRLVAEHTDRGDFISTARTSRSHAGIVLRQQPSFPPDITDTQLFDLLSGAESAGLLARVAFRRRDRHEGERWELTDAGRARAALPAATSTAASAMPGSTVAASTSADDAQPDEASPVAPEQESGPAGLADEDLAACGDLAAAPVWNAESNGDDTHAQRIAAAIDAAAKAWGSDFDERQSLRREVLEAPEHVRGDLLALLEQRYGRPHGFQPRPVSKTVSTIDAHADNYAAATHGTAQTHQAIHQ